MSRGYEILSLDDLPRHPNAGDGKPPYLLPLRRRLGLRAFGANAWTAAVGEHVVPPHSEVSGDEELYVVVRGRATFTVDERTVDAPAGTLVHVRSGESRVAVAEEPETLVLAVGATPGEAFAARGWDDVVAAFGEARAGRVAEGRAVFTTLVAQHPDDWPGAYNLACFEARFGDPEAAFAALERAVELGGEQPRELAREDDDLVPLRDDPRWGGLVG